MSLFAHSNPEVPEVVERYMKRREFIVASSVSAAGLILPGFGHAAVPCPPSPVSASGGTTATTPCPSSTSAASYTTNFDATENPLSEGGHWVNGGTTGLDWQNVRSASGLAYGTGPSYGYDDCIAHLTNHSIGANHQVSGTVRLASGYVASSSHELGLYLRMQISAHLARGYEILFPSPGGGVFQVMVWEGAMGAFHEITGKGGGGTLPRALRDGDVVSAKIVGSTITVALNGTVFNTTVDSTYTSGNPGMGFFMRPGAGDISNFCLTSWTAQNA
jgi:hypothetical protein